MSVAPDIRIAQPLPGTVINGAGTMIAVSGWCMPSPGGGVIVTGWLERPGGGTTPPVPGTLVFGTPGVNWGLSIPAPAGGANNSFTLTVRLVWSEPSLPGGASACEDEVVIVLNT